MRATRPTWQHAPFRRLRSKQDPILELPNFALHPKSLPFPLPLNRLDIRQGNINYPRYNFIRTFFLIELKEKKKVISFSEIQSGERELMHERKREREKKKTRGLLQRNHFPRDELWRQPEHVQLPAMHDMKIVASRRNITGITGRQRNIGFSAVSFPFRIHNPSIIGTRVNLQEVTRRKHATRNIAGCIVSLISLYYTIIEKKVAITGNTRVTRVSLTPSSRR